MRATGSPFEEVVASTQCPFASSAAVDFGAPWRGDLPFGENLRRTAQELENYCASARARRSAGFVFEPWIGPAARSFAAVRGAMRQVMFGLAATDADADAALNAEDIQQPGWQFRFSGVRLFTSLFAPCYPPSHTKHLPATEHIAIFFQPDFSFDFCHVSRDSAALRDGIRRRFLEAGRPYDVGIIDARVEAHIYMSPLRIGDSAVAWWELGPEDHPPDVG